MKQALVVHGGCAAVTAEEETIREAACERAADAGWKVLQAGGSALDAVEIAVCRLCDLMSGGASLEMAGNTVMKEIEALATASTGLIAIDAGGAIVTLWDTRFMATARRGGAPGMKV